MDAKITKIEIIPCKMPLKETFVIAKGPLNIADLTVVKIYSDQGEFGTGECTPIRTIYTETQEGSVAEGERLAQLILGQNPMNISKINQIMESCITGPSSMRSAIDMALHDLKSRLLKIPLYQLLGGDPNKKMVTDMTVSFLSKDEMVKQAMKYKDMGFNTLKIKLGDKERDKDIHRVKAIRAAVGDDISLRIDANQGWIYPEAVYNLKEMEDLNIAYCEAPIFAKNIQKLKAIKQAVNIPLMGDESIFDHRDAVNMLHMDCVDMVNIKLGKTGGIGAAMKTASVAEGFGVSCQVGCFSETRLGITALAHFSSVWSNIIYFDMDAPLMHAIDPIQGGIEYNQDWSIKLPKSEGLGARYDESFLQDFDPVVC